MIRPAEPGRPMGAAVDRNREQPPLRLLAPELQGYVTTNPDAKETLEGIHRCWPSQSEQCSADEVRTVVERLVREGCMTAAAATPGLRLFGPSPAFVANLAAFTQLRRNRRL